MQSHQTKIESKVLAKFKRYCGEIQKLSVFRWTEYDWLWALIFAGLTVRFFYPFFDNPFDHLVSDSSRHFLSATGALNYWIFAMSDGLGYQIWLSAFAHIFGQSRPLVALYCGIMGTTTAYLWYCWFKLCLPSKKLALIAYVLIVWLPDWTKLFVYFLDETLLLLLVGLMLYLGWTARRTLSLRDCLIFAAVAGFSFLTKATCAPQIAFTYLFLGVSLYSHLPRRIFFKQVFLSLSLTVLICLLAPLSFYARTGAWSWFLPAQAQTNKMYYESGKQTLAFHSRYFDRQDGVWKTEDYWFGNPSYYTPQLLPFSDWKSPRTGDCCVVMDFGEPYGERFFPKVEVSLRRRIELTLENWIYLFVGFVWPVEFPNSAVNFERWLWPIFTLIIVASVCRRRRLNELDILSLGTLLILMFQQECAIEGRYRLTWEGVMIPAVVLSIRNLSKKRFKYSRPRG